MTDEADPRSGRTKKIAITMLLIAVVGTVLFKWFTTSTPISKRDALEIFVADNAAAGPQRVAESLQQGVAPTDSRKGRKGRTETSSTGDTGLIRSGGSSRSGVQDPGEHDEAVQVLSMPHRYIPEEGVYTYRTEGAEGISGYDVRHFPSRTYRNIVHTGSRSWTEHHTYIEEHEGWSEFRFDGTAQLVDATRHRLVFGPRVEDESLYFDPPLRLVWLPWAVGREWEGAFDGETEDGRFYGSYSASTGAHTYLDVGQQRVEVWLDELIVILHGDIEGTLELRRWTSPLYGVAIREEVVVEAERTPLTYTADWTLHLASTEPDR